MLEDTVARLEARLHELENPDASSASVTLHDPYVRYNDSQSNPKTPLLVLPEGLSFGPLSPFSPTSSSSSLPSGSGRQWHNFASLDAMTESTGSSGLSTSPNQRITSSPFLGADVSHYCNCAVISYSRVPNLGTFILANRNFVSLLMDSLLTL